MTAANASVFCPFPLSFHPLQGGFPSEAREPSGGTLRRLQGVQKKEKELSDPHFIFIWGHADRLLNVMWRFKNVVVSGQLRCPRRKSQNRCPPPPPKNLPAHVGHPVTLAVNSFIRFYRSFASLLQERTLCHVTQPIERCLRDISSLSPSIFCQYLPRDLATPQSGRILSGTVPSVYCIWRCVNVVPQWLCLYIKSAGCKFQILSLWYSLWVVCRLALPRFLQAVHPFMRRMLNKLTLIWSEQWLMTLPASFCMCLNSQERENGDLTRL